MNRKGDGWHGQAGPYQPARAERENAQAGRVQPAHATRQIKILMNHRGAKVAKNTNLNWFLRVLCASAIEIRMIRIQIRPLSPVPRIASFMLPVRNPRRSNVTY
jgi:hypothetical protein